MVSAVGDENLNEPELDISAWLSSSSSRRFEYVRLLPLKLSLRDRNGEHADRKSGSLRPHAVKISIRRSEAYNSFPTRSVSCEALPKPWNESLPGDRKVLARFSFEIYPNSLKMKIWSSLNLFDASIKGSKGVDGLVGSAAAESERSLLLVRHSVGDMFNGSENVGSFSPKFSRTLYRDRSAVSSSLVEPFPWDSSGNRKPWLAADGVLEWSPLSPPTAPKSKSNVSRSRSWSVKVDSKSLSSGLARGEKDPKSFEEPVDELAGIRELRLRAFFAMFDEESAVLVSLRVDEVALLLVHSTPAFPHLLHGPKGVAIPAVMMNGPRSHFSL